MKGRLIWRLLLALVLACVLAPARAVLAQEAGAVVVAEGTMTTRINGEEVASSRQLESVVVAGAGFDANEVIALWLTLPDGSVLGLDDDDILADDEGVFAIELGLGSGLPTGLHRFTARGQTSGAGGIVPFYLMPGAGPEETAGTLLEIFPGTAAQLDEIELSASGFGANELVSLWVTLPDGSVVGLGELRADAAGAFGVALLLPGELPVGRHFFTARGTSSGNTAITPFDLQYGNGLDVPGAELAADFGQSEQGTLLVLSTTGALFTPSEAISFWLTLPNGAVLGLGNVAADADGNLDVVVPLGPDLPVGTHYLSFRSNESDQVGFLKIDLLPGPPSAE